MLEIIPVLLKVPTSHGRFNEVVHLISKSLRENGNGNVTTYDNFVHAPKHEEVERDRAVFRRFVS